MARHEPPLRPQINVMGIWLQIGERASTLWKLELEAYALAEWTSTGAEDPEPSNYYEYGTTVF